MKDRIQLIYKPTTLQTSNITFRLISDAADKEKNVVETEDLHLYIRNNSISVQKFLIPLIDEGMMPIFIFLENNQEKEDKQFSPLKESDTF